MESVKKHYNSVGYWHHYEYRHILRPGQFEEWHKHTRTLTSKQWDRLYRDILRSIVKQGLDPQGYSEAHTRIIAEKMGLDPDHVIKCYHG